MVIMPSYPSATNKCDHILWSKLQMLITCGDKAEVCGLRHKGREPLSGEEGSEVAVQGGALPHSIHPGLRPGVRRA